MRIIPLIILILMSGISLGLDMERHGKHKEGTYSIWSTIIALLIQWGVILWMIW